MANQFKMVYQDLTNQKYTDCSFVFKENGEKKILVAHKNILACVSPVFEAMFFGSVKEETEVLVEDVSSKTFEQFLLFLYTEELKVADAKEACDFYYASKKYDVPIAVNAARSYMADKMNEADSKIYLGTVKLFEDQELLEKCCGHLEENIYNATKAPNFFNDREPLELNDKIKFNAANTLDDSDFEVFVKKYKTELFKMENYDDLINNCLGLIRKLVIETKNMFKMIISDKTAAFDTSLNLVPAASSFFEVNKICSTHTSPNQCHKECSCCNNLKRCTKVSSLSFYVVSLVLRKYPIMNLATFWFEDIKTIFQEYEC